MHCAARFSLVFLVVAWYSMAFTQNAGAAVHHAILLWPFPHLFIAVVLAGISGGIFSQIANGGGPDSLRHSVPVAAFAPGSASSKLSAMLLPAAVLMGAMLVVFNLLVVNQYVLQFERDGAAGNFTDALNTLSDALRDPLPGNSAQPEGAEAIYVTDWGMLNTLMLFHQGRLDLREGTESFLTDHPDMREQQLRELMFSNPRALYIGHTGPRVVFPDRVKRMEQAVLAAGLHKADLRIISDSNGHPVFEIFRLAR